MKDIARMLQQVQQMKGDLERRQRETEAKFTANGVTVVAKGDFTIAEVTIEPKLLSELDAEMLADVVMVAVNGALDKVRRQLEGQIGNLAQGLNLPGFC